MWYYRGRSLLDLQSASSSGERNEPYMGRDTDFNFGWNETADNADPWGRNNTGVDSTPYEAQNAGLSGCADSAPVSEENWREEETCEYVKKQIYFMTQTVRKANRMAILQRGNAGDQGSSNGPGRGRGGRQNTGGIQNLSSEHLSTDPKRAKIMGTKIPEKWYAVIVKVFVNGNVYFWNLKTNNPNYDKLIEAFGPDTDGWTDQEFMIANHIDDWNGRAFPSFVEKVEKGAAAGKGKR